jgi:hypothetical protein
MSVEGAGGNPGNRPRPVRTAPSRPPSPAFGWNVAVIVVGVLIAVIGLINGLAANPDNNALRQTVGALWVIQGFLGLLIAAVGILGASLISALNMQMEPRANPEVPPGPVSGEVVGHFEPAEAPFPKAWDLRMRFIN